MGNWIVLETITQLIESWVCRMKDSLQATSSQDARLSGLH